MNNLLSQKDTQAVLDILVEQLGVQQTQLTPEARISSSHSGMWPQSVTSFAALCNNRARAVPHAPAPIIVILILPQCRFGCPWMWI